MGADIHFVVERKFHDRWIGVYSTGVTPSFPRDSDLLHGASTSVWERQATYRRRNYEFFAALAGVRGPGPDPKGMPPDASELAQIEGSPHNSNWHSHSWCSLGEFIRTWERTQPPEYTAAWVANELTGKNDLSRHEGLLGRYNEWDTTEGYRVVFWFDN